MMPNDPLPILPPEHTAAKLGTVRLRESELDHRFIEALTLDGKCLALLKKP